MEIVFPCDNCGTNLVAEEDGAGQYADCPVCGKMVLVPELTEVKSPASTHPASSRKKVIIHIPAESSEDVEEDKTASEDAEFKSHPHRENHYIEIVVGWICVAIGVLLALALPRAYLAYIPFFVSAFLMGVILLIHGKVAHGLVLLLCTCVPPPLLMRNNLWKEFRTASQEARSASSPRKVVFDANGKVKVAPAEESVLRYRSAPKRERLADRGKVSFAQLMGEEPPPVAVSEKKVKTSPSSASLTKRKADEKKIADEPALTGSQARDDPYAELLAGTAEVPTLVSEDELAATELGEKEDFLWQEEKEEALARLPGEPAPVVDVPFVIYSEANEKKTYYPGGTIGNETALSIDDSWDVSPRFGSTCMRIAYASGMDWVIAAWQHPRGNWGDMIGGYDLSNASKLTFWAKGDAGHEEVEFMVGMEQSLNAVSRDSLKASSGIIRLKKKWKKYSIPLKKYDRTSIVTGFMVKIEGQDEPIIFYLDNVQYE